MAGTLSQKKGWDIGALDALIRGMELGESRAPLHTHLYGQEDRLIIRLHV